MRLGIPIRQAAAHPHGVLALKQIAAPIVQQLPRQRQQASGGFFGGSLRFRATAVREVAIHQHRKATLRPCCGVLPGVQRLLRMLGGDHRVVQVLPPLRQLGLDALGTRLEHPGRPQVVALQVPAEFVRLNRAEGCSKGETSTLDPTRGRVGRAHRPVWP